MLAGCECQNQSTRRAEARDGSSADLMAGAVTIGDAAVTNRSPSSAKVDRFRSLFKGRSDVFPLRWENRNSARAGYSPACSNEWARGICAKPKVNCGQCLHQAFLPVSDEIVARHLRGGGTRSADFVAGVYRLKQSAGHRRAAARPGILQAHSRPNSIRNRREEDATCSQAPSSRHRVFARRGYCHISGRRSFRRAGGSDDSGSR